MLVRLERRSRAAVLAECAGSARSAQAIQPPVSTNTAFIPDTTPRRDRRICVRRPTIPPAEHDRGGRRRARLTRCPRRRQERSETQAGCGKSP